MAFLNRIFGERPTKTAHPSHRPLPSPLVHEQYEEDLSESSADSDYIIPFSFLPREYLKTNLASVAFACLSHYLYGIFFNAYESVNTRYNYPNLGSMSFVLATAILLVRFNLLLKSLPIGARTWRLTVYKILAVTFIAHLVLAGIWQQLVNLTWEVFFVAKDLLEYLNSNSEKGLLYAISSRMTSRMVNLLTHLEGLAILVTVLYSRAE